MMKRKIVYFFVSLYLCMVFSCSTEELPGIGEKKNFVRWYNNKLSDYIELCSCNSSCMYELSMSDSRDMIYWKINHDFREDVEFDCMDEELFMQELNKYFQIPIYRFCDTNSNKSNSVDCSLKVLYDENIISRVNVEGYTRSSFQCVRTGTKNAPFNKYLGREFINDGWMSFAYNSKYPFYENGGRYYSGYTRLFEPSAIISDDGERIELFGQIGYTESTDGINWSDPISLKLPGGHASCSHSSVNKVDGLYMMVGCTSNSAATEGSPVYQDLWTSSDRINWQWRGHIVSTNDNIGSGQRFVIMGNSYLFKDDGGTYYLYYEGARVSPQWEICLMTCTDLFCERGDGFIGNWQQCPENPILPFKYNPYTNTSAFCNPEFVKGQDNQPIKLDGKYYMYYLTGYLDDNGDVQDTINRMYSFDLIHWVEEGAMFDNRDIADGGEGKGDNGDQCLCEFKGRTFFFYTHNMNSYGYSEANIRYTIDNRPIEELMKLKP